MGRRSITKSTVQGLKPSSLRMACRGFVACSTSRSHCSRSATAAWPSTSAARSERGDTQWLQLGDPLLCLIPYPLTARRGDTQWLQLGDPLRGCSCAHRTTRLCALSLTRPFDGRLYWLLSRPPQAGG